MMFKKRSAEQRPHASTLVIVCCHAIFTGTKPWDESHWRLASFQKSSQTRPGEHETFLLHIRAGLAALYSWKHAKASKDKSVIVVFSGGRTSPVESHPSEAQSYLNAIYAHATIDEMNTVHQAKHAVEQGRLLLEENATDSFQNLLFSILLFRRKCGYYPNQVRVITHAFKTDRFIKLHAPAIRWPAHRLSVHGINPVLSAEELVATEQGERLHAYEPWMRDPFGAYDSLARKRRERGWDPRTLDIIVQDLEPEVVDLTYRMNAEETDPIKTLPWEEIRRGHNAFD